MAFYTLEKPDTYGITVDCKQRVWLAGPSDGMKRYDPSLPESERFQMTSNMSAGANVIAADAKGYIWGSHPDSKIIRQDAEDLSPAGSTFVPVRGAYGMAVDRTGKVWAIPQVNEIERDHLILGIGRNRIDLRLNLEVSAPSDRARLEVQ